MQPLEPGLILRARYRIVKMVGQGGMGAIYLAEDLRLEGRQCAIKETAPDSGADPDVLVQTQEQFYREASVLARLDHPNLPKVSDYFTETGRDYLVMDYVPGRDLRELIDEARRQDCWLEQAAVLGWMDQLCDAVGYLHTQEPPVLHRDIKPANIKLTAAGNVKLVDFGLVKLLAPDDPRTITVIQGRGSVQYTPLEQYGGDSGHTDVRSDVYSVGATLYHLISGQPPLEAKQRFLRPDGLVPPRALNTGISIQTERAVLKAMAMHPDDRFATIDDFRRALLNGTPLGHVRMLHSRLVGPASWPAAVRANLVWILLVVVVLLLALSITLQSPTVAVPDAPPPAAEVLFSS